MGERDPELQRLLDQQAIHDVVVRYCRGIDRMDEAMVRSCYHPDATDEHGSFFGDVDAFCAWVFGRMLPRFASTFHFVGNVLVEVDHEVASRAKCETYGIAFHRAIDPSKPERSLTSAFRYVDDFERRDGAWKIARRVCTLEWARHDDPAEWWEAPPEHRRGTRDRTDPVYWPWGEHTPWPPTASPG